MSAVQELLKRRPTTLRVLSASVNLAMASRTKPLRRGSHESLTSLAVTWDQSTRAPLT
jgi:hypothetical protein